MTIEPLESRIAPAAVITFTDVDGDLVTVKSSKGTLVQLEAAVQRNMVGMTQQITAITLDPMIFNGADFSVDAKIVEAGSGDGLVNVPAFNALSVNFGKLSIDGNVQAGQFGDSNGSRPGAKTFIVDSLGSDPTAMGVGTFQIFNGNNKAGSVEVRNGLGGGLKLSINGDVNKLTIGAGLDAGDASDSAYVVVTGDANSVVVNGSFSSTNNVSNAGLLVFGDLKSLKVMGSLYGSDSAFSGGVYVGGDLGTATIGGALIQGNAEGAGALLVAGTIKSVTVNGGIIGEGASPAIAAGYDTMQHAVVGNSGIGSVTINGATGTNNTAFIVASGDIGKATFQSVGAGLLYSGGKIGKVEVKGTADYMLIASHGDITGVKVAGSFNGAIQSGQAITVGQSTLPSAGIGKIEIGGSMFSSTISGGDASSTVSKIGSVIVKGNATGSFINSNEIASVTLGGIKVTLAKGANNDANKVFAGVTFNEM